MSVNRLVLLTVIERGTSLLEAQLSGLDYELETFLFPDEAQTVQAAQGADVIFDVGVPFPGRVLGQLQRPQAIVTQGHGFDHIDVDVASQQGIMVVNTPGFCTEEVSNHALALLLACARQIVSLDRLVRKGGWTSSGRNSFGLLSRLAPIPPIDGQVLGLVSFGGIARVLARKAQSLGLEVVAHDPYLPPWIAQEYRVELIPSLEELASHADFVSVHVPNSVNTKEMIGKEFFRAMKSKAFFINTGRGQTVDEPALIAALQKGEIAGAGLDVFKEEPLSLKSPLLGLDNVIVTPHSAGLSTQIWDRGDRIMGQEAVRILEGTWPMSLANPEVRKQIKPRPQAGSI